MIHVSARLDIRDFTTSLRKTPYTKKAIIIRAHSSVTWACDMGIHPTWAFAIHRLSFSILLPEPTSPLRLFHSEYTPYGPLS